MTSTATATARPTLSPVQALSARICWDANTEQYVPVSLTHEQMRQAHVAHSDSRSAGFHACDSADQFTPCSWFASHGF